MDRMAILAKTQKRHEGKTEKGGGGLQQPPPPPERERGLNRKIASVKVVIATRK